MLELQIQQETLRRELQALKDESLAKVFVRRAKALWSR
jgi:hypothetical protein